MKPFGSFRICFLLLTALTLNITNDVAAQSPEQAEAARRKMVDTAVIGAGVKDQRVIESMLATPRHEFVQAKYRHQAYMDMALPIGDKQTISSPFIVSYMTQSIEPKPTDRVLEIGTGSGYQAAILSPLVKEVYTIEIVEPLGKRAARTLKRLRYQNVFSKVGDGYKGWPEHAPFDKIIVTCSPEKVPQPLIDQLKEGGLIVIPVGERYQQTLYLMRKENGTLKSEALRPTLFVPMTGAAEARREVKPDPKNPSIVNGDFEGGLGDDGFIAGWYYQRQCELVEDARAPEGEHYVVFKNSDEGRDAHLMQGFSIDGKVVTSLRLRASVKYDGVRQGRNAHDVPLVAVTFYDADRKSLGTSVLGPFRGSAEWHREERLVRVPPLAREGILRIGLFGATGEICFDYIKLFRVR